MKTTLYSITEYILQCRGCSPVEFQSFRKNKNISIETEVVCVCVSVVTVKRSEVDERRLWTVRDMVSCSVSFAINSRVAREKFAEKLYGKTTGKF